MVGKLDYAEEVKGRLLYANTFPIPPVNSGELGNSVVLQVAGFLIKPQPEQDRRSENMGRETVFRGRAPEFVCDALAEVTIHVF